MFHKNQTAQRAVALIFCLLPFGATQLTTLSLSSLVASGAAHATEIQSGTASWYGPGLQGNKTANGERFDMNEFTAAHPSLPFGTQVRVINQRNGKSVVVRINDRGPFVRGRIIDVSRAAAQQLGMINRGTAPVVLEIVG